MSDIFNDKNFGEETELTNQTVDWGVVGDFVQGTFVVARHGVQTQFGENSIYEILAEKGQFNQLKNKKLTGNVITIHKGETWSVWGRSDVFNGQMNSLKPGQVVKIIYTDDVDTKMGSMKMVKIRAPRNNDGSPVMNQEWLDQQGVAGGDM